MRELDRPGRSTVYAANGMAATSHPLSTAAAIGVLRDGGNAMDAAVAACAVQCVVEPHSTGIGGDCFCLYSPKGEGVIAFDGSGRAPAAATADWYLNRGIGWIEQQTPHAVTVPGAIDAWSRLLADHGTRTLGDALQPAIRYAVDGFPVHHRQHHDWVHCEAALARDAAAAEYYLRNGRAPAIGTLVRLPRLAESLEAIAEKGRAGFYEGWVAEDIVDYLRGMGGLHTLEDFAAARGDYVAPVRTAYRGYDVYECPPPGQGVVALAMLNILEGFDLASLSPLSAERLHLEIEAARIAFRDRNAVLADPAVANVPVADWLSDGYAASQRARIRTDRRLDPLPPTGLPRHGDTVYLTVVDRERNAVSLINSVFSSFGSCLVTPKSGVVLQNRGQGFVIDPGHPNCIAPGKRPMHTIIPGMLAKDGKAQMPFGVMGGHYQPVGHVHLLTNLLDYGMDLQEAVDLARVFPDPFETEEWVLAESGVPDAALAGLQRLGHRLYRSDSPIGGAQAIWIDWEEGVLRGASEPRKDGMAIGY
jgi:gamma-glutamyltranspeptidase/glutathione hydrolase